VATVQTFEAGHFYRLGSDFQRRQLGWIDEFLDPLDDALIPGQLDRGRRKQVAQMVIRIVAVVGAQRVLQLQRLGRDLERRKLWRIDRFPNVLDDALIPWQRHRIRRKET